MYCIKCGAELKSGAQFCSKCGSPVQAGKKGNRKKQKQSSSGRKNTNGKAVQVPMPLLVIGGLVILFLGVVLLLHQPNRPAQVAATAPQQSAMRPDVYAVATQFTCPCGQCQDNLAVCDCTNPHGAMEAKQYIAQGLDQGRTQDQMVTAVQLKYNITPTQTSTQ